jgi:tagatose-1,6-bisphosphate aldolase
MSHPIAGGPDKKSDPKGFARIKPDLVISTAAELTKPEYHVDVLKAEFPLDLKYAEELGQDPAEACRELTEASRVPWVVLSAGVDYPEFRENVKYAVQNGASGFLAGRAIWKEGVGRKDIDEFLLTTGVKRLNELSDLVERYATPWYKKYADSIEEIEVVRGE